VSNPPKVVAGSALIGKSVPPTIARKYEKNFAYDGYGTILAIKKPVTERQFKLVLEAIIKPLSETHSGGLNPVKTPGECVVNIAALLKHNDEPIALQDMVKATWLDGGLSRQSVVNMCSLLNVTLSATSPSRSGINTILSNLEPEFIRTRRNDAFYPRLFETALAEEIVHQPTAEMNEVRDAIALFLVNHFLMQTNGDEERRSICEKVASAMLADPAIWRSEIPEAQMFLSTRSPDDFVAMLQSKGRYSIPLVVSLVVKYAVSSSTLSEVVANATQYYVDKIKPERDLISAPTDQPNKPTNLHGLLLPYQRGANSRYGKINGSGVRPIDRYVRPSAGKGLTSHDLVAVSSERAIGIGMSGSANIVNFVLHELMDRGQPLHLNDAQLATAAWLTFSGGQSFNEAYSVFSHLDSSSFKPLSFVDLQNQSEGMASAVSSAFERLMEKAAAFQPVATSSTL
jgi:hypothetical protein